MANIRITVDEEFGDEQWWPAAYEQLEHNGGPKALQPILYESESEIIVSQEEAEAIEIWCAAIPGWGEGTEYASHPLLFNPADEPTDDH